MTARHFRQALKLDVPPTRKHVFGVLCFEANEDRLLTTSVPQIIDWTNLADRTVRRQMKALQKTALVDLVRWTEGRNAAVTIRVNPVRETALTPVENAASVTAIPAINAAAEAAITDLNPAAEAALPREGAGSTPPSTTPPSLVEDGQNPTATSDTAWLDDLYRLGWAKANPLTQREVDRLMRDYGTLDIADEIEKFVGYWQQQKRPKTWSTYLRLRTWLGRAKKDAGHGQHVRPVGPEEVAEGYSRLRGARPDA